MESMQSTINKLYFKKFFKKKLLREKKQKKIMKYHICYLKITKMGLLMILIGLEKHLEEKKHIIVTYKYVFP